MVVVTELDGLFFGQALQGNGDSTDVKKVEVKPEKMLSLTMASLDVTTECDEYVPVVVQMSEKSKYTICTLSKTHNLLQQPLQLLLNIGEATTFYLNCKNANVHLTGYYMNQNDCEHDHDGNPNMSEMDARNALLSRLMGPHDEDDDDSDDDDDDDQFGQEDSDDDDEDDDEDDDDDDESEDVESEGVNSKKRKMIESKKNNKKNGNSKTETESKDEKPPKLVPIPTNEGKEATSPAKIQTLQGGVQVKVIKEGSGPVAKKGKVVHVYYTGKLKENGKKFDSCTSGKPFKFKLGGGEVIKGWDIGIENMKVGGKAELTIPAPMAYGKKRMGPDIPANSALVFDVELKAVS